MLPEEVLCCTRETWKPGLWEKWVNPHEAFSWAEIMEKVHFYILLCLYYLYFYIFLCLWIKKNIICTAGQYKKRLDVRTKGSYTIFFTVPFLYAYICTWELRLWVCCSPFSCSFVFQDWCCSLGYAGCCNSLLWSNDLGSYLCQCLTYGSM